MSRRYDFNQADIVGVLASHEIVFGRPSHNHLTECLSIEVAETVLEVALSQINAFDQEYVTEQVACAETGLQSRCVTTSESDEIFYAHRRGREGPTRFVVNRQPDPTNHITVVLGRDRLKPGVMGLITAICGRRAQPEPWDRRLTDSSEIAASKVFWSTHALVFDYLNPEHIAEIDPSQPQWKANSPAKSDNTKIEEKS